MRGQWSLRKAVLAVYLAAFAANAGEPVNVFELTNAGKRCFVQDDHVTTECDFNVGSLVIAIAGVNEDSASVSFQNSYINADFYAKYVVQHGCVVVVANPAKFGFPVLPAFINPRTAAVYNDWVQCGRSVARRK